MPRPNPTPEPALLPEHLINVGDVDSETLWHHQRRARRRATAQRPPHAVDGCIRVPQPLSVHTESTYAATTQDVNISSTIVSEAGPSSTSFIPQPHYAFTYPSGPLFRLHIPLLLPNHLFSFHHFHLHYTILPIPPHNSQTSIILNFHLLLCWDYHKWLRICKLLNFHQFFLLPPKIFFPHLVPLNLMKCVLPHISHLQLIQFFTRRVTLMLMTLMMILILMGVSSWI